MTTKAKRLIFVLLFLLCGFYGFAVIIDGTFDPRLMQPDTLKGTFVTWLMVAVCITTTTFITDNKN